MQSILVKEIFEAAEIDGKYINHRLHATRVSALFNAGLPEAVIQKQSGHKGTEKKENTYEEQLKAARSEAKLRSVKQEDYWH